jgi:hypothetical protein
MLGGNSRPGVAESCATDRASFSPPTRSRRPAQLRSRIQGQGVYRQPQSPPAPDASPGLRRRRQAAPGSSGGAAQHLEVIVANALSGQVLQILACCAHAARPLSAGSQHNREPAQCHHPSEGKTVPEWSRLSAMMGGRWSHNPHVVTPVGGTSSLMQQRPSTWANLGSEKP